MSGDSVCTCGADNKGTTTTTTTITANLTGIPLFKTIVRRVRQKITESKLVRSTSIAELSATVAKLDRMSMDDHSTSSNRETISPPTSLLGCEAPRNGYGSDTGSSTGRRPDTRVRIRQKMRSRSKSDSRKCNNNNNNNNKKKPKTILRPPPTYIYVRGLSGIPTQRITVR